MSLKQIFGVKSSSDKWKNIRTAYAEYKRSSPKSVESIEFVVAGLNHLREWIIKESNGVEHTAAELFCKNLSDNDSYKAVKEISERAKHYSATAPKVSPKYDRGSVLADWGELTRMGTLAEGSPVDFVLGDGRSITEIVDEVMLEYSEWFDRASA